MHAGENTERRAVQTGSFRNPLLVHDTLIAGAVLKTIVEQWRDALVAVVVVATAIAFLRGAVWSLDVKTASLLAPCVASSVALLLDIALRSRVRHFSSVSALAPAALITRNRVGFRLTIHLAASVAAAVLLLMPDRNVTVRFLLAWWTTLLPVQLIAGIGASGLARKERGTTGFVLLVALWRSRATAAGARWMTLATSGAIALALLYGPSGAEPFIAAAAAFFTLAWYSPVDHGVVDFERFAGRDPIGSVRASLGIAAGMAVIFVLAAAVSTNLSGVIMVASVAAAVMTYRLLMILLSRIVAAHQVQFAMLVVLFVALSIVVALPWAVPLVLGGVLAWLVRHGRRRTWLLP